MTTKNGLRWKRVEAGRYVARTTDTSREYELLRIVYDDPSEGYGRSSWNVIVRDMRTSAESCDESRTLLRDAKACALAMEMERNERGSTCRWTETLGDVLCDGSRDGK